MNRLANKQDRLSLQQESVSEKKCFVELLPIVKVCFVELLPIAKIWQNITSLDIILLNTASSVSGGTTPFIHIEIVAYLFFINH